MSATPTTLPAWVARREPGRRRAATIHTREHEESRELLRAFRGTGPRHAKEQTHG